jgi:hypothetical protein
LPSLSKNSNPSFLPASLSSLSRSPLLPIKLARRTKLITQLEQQRELAKDERYVVKRRKWVKGEDGSSSWSMRRNGLSDGGG